MSTPFHHELRYDGADLAEVQQMLRSPDFREKVCDYQHVVRRTATITPLTSETRDASMTVRLEYAHGSQMVPSFAKRFVGDEIAIVQTEQWGSLTDATLEVLIPGKPGSLAGTVHLAETAGGVTETVRGVVKVSIPLVGGKIEDLIAGLLLKALKAENRVGTAWLAGDR